MLIVPIDSPEVEKFCSNWWSMGLHKHRWSIRYLGLSLLQLIISFEKGILPFYLASFLSLSTNEAGFRDLLILLVFHPLNLHMKVILSALLFTAPRCLDDYLWDYNWFTYGYGESEKKKLSLANWVDGGAGNGNISESLFRKKSASGIK